MWLPLSGILFLMDYTPKELYANLFYQNILKKVSAPQILPVAKDFLFQQNRNVRQKKSHLRPNEVFF